MYVEAFAAPLTVDTMPEPTLKAFADHGEIGELLPADGGDCELVLERFQRAGVEVGPLAAQLQGEGTDSFSKAWEELLQTISSKRRQSAIGR